MLEQIKLAWAWLGAQNAALPYLSVTLLALFATDLWKAASPKSWLWFVTRTPWAEEISEAQELAHNLVLALPSVLAGGVATAVLSGGDVTTTVVGLIAGAGAPLMHHVRKSLKKPPSGGDGDEKPVGTVTHIVIPGPDGEPPARPPAAAIGALALVGLLACACSRDAAKGAVEQLNDPCSKLSLATVVAGCEARIKRECDPGDQSCSPYLECKRAVEVWRACPTEP